MRTTTMSSILAGCISSLCMVSAVQTLAAVVSDTRSVAESSKFLVKISGVYKDQFQNGDVTGYKYQSENILEIVPVDEHSAYVRMHLEFFNGHLGAIYGVATYGDGSLIYDNGEAGDDRCLVEYIWSDQKIITRADYDKTPGCRNYHGARGTLTGLEFAVKKRREIRYLQRLKDSSEFKESMDRYRRQVNQAKTSSS